MNCAVRPLVFIVILNWNGYQDTLRCVVSLEAQHYPNCKILVLDNGSVDGSVAALRSLGSRIHLIEAAENLGYTGGNNRAMRLAFELGADYVWLFNNDAVADPDTLVRLINVCEADPMIGLASPLVREAADHRTIQFAGGLFDLATPAYTPTYEVEQAREWQVRFPERIALVGTAMLVKRAVYRRIGGLDERIFAYWEDIDYSIRSALAGFCNVMVFEATVFHLSKPTITEPNTVKPHYYYFMTRNEILMWRGFCRRLPFIKAVYWVIRRQFRQILSMPDNAAGLDAVLAGLWDGWWGIGGRYNPDRRMPSPFRQLLGQRAKFWRSFDRRKAMAR
jgi:GT2 family glycosyltransferase